MRRVLTEAQKWELQMRRLFLTATQVKEALGLSRDELRRMRVSGELGYVTLGTEDFGISGQRKIRRMLRYAPNCHTCDSYRWCIHNGGCGCPGLDQPHPPHL